MSLHVLIFDYLLVTYPPVHREILALVVLVVGQEMPG